MFDLIHRSLNFLYNFSYSKFRYRFVKNFRWNYLKTTTINSARISSDVIRDFSRNRCHFYSMSYLFKHLTRSTSRRFLWTFCFCSITKTLGRGVGGLLEFHWIPYWECSRDSYSYLTVLSKEFRPRTSTINPNVVV